MLRFLVFLGVINFVRGITNNHMRHKDDTFEYESGKLTTRIIKNSRAHMTYWTLPGHREIPLNKVPNPFFELLV